MKLETSLKQILVSQTRLKLINILFYFPKEIYYVRQLVRMTGEEINSVRRELANLQKAGVVTSEHRSNRLYYCANKQSPLFTDLALLANKASGLGLSIHGKADKLGQLKMLVYSYKFFVGDENTNDDIDLIVVGDVSIRELEPLIKAEEERRGHEINYMVMDKNELQLRKQKRDQFIVDFFLSCPIVIIGNHQDIANL